jgi:type VI protein secretion system component VasK
VSPARLVGFLLAGLMVGGGGFLFAAGNGWVGDSQSTVWAVVGGVLAGLGVALVISIVQTARQRAQLSQLERNRYGGRR